VLRVALTRRRVDLKQAANVTDAVMQQQQQQQQQQLKHAFLISFDHLAGTQIFSRAAKSRDFRF